MTVVDATDFDDLSRFKWHVAPAGPNIFYAQRVFRDPLSGVAVSEFMHRRLVPEATVVDHKNGNGLDNRRSNLRVATNRQNSWNRTRLSSNNTTGFRGVTRDRGKWKAAITSNHVTTNLGRYDSPEEAARAYDAAARRLFGEFHGYINFPGAKP